ncbi:MAG: (2Fe-2S) ferredoxin domain-containing protein [Bacteroidia bacterium]|nr:(2Fe-2S) ferredoxin domain-containing protein [Bacteroidia bacterium]
MIYEKHLFICTHERPNSYKKSCGESVGLALVGEFKLQIKNAKLPIKIRAQKAGCLDLCDNGPMVVVYPEGVFYKNVQLADVEKIVTNHLINGNIVEELQCIR